MFERDQGFLFGEDSELLAEWHALCERREQNLEQKRVYEVARREAWYNGCPFPEDQKKWYAFTNDCPHGVKEKERVRGEYREWYWEHAEWRLHATESRRARQLGRRVGRRDAILRVYARARAEEAIPCYWCKRPTTPDDREVDHIVPLTRGGHHMARNLAISCRNCNQAKSDQMPGDFMRSIRLLRNENISRLRRGLQDQFRFEFAQLPPIKCKGPRRATQLTLLKLRA
jgi:5-methylcytosine-specific restriction endonuclease McrA